MFKLCLKRKIYIYVSYYVKLMIKNWQEMLKTETIATLGKLTVDSKTVLLLSGESMAGKTIACLHLTDSAIRNNYKVLYFDTDEKKILARPQPNLFKEFYTKEKDKYDALFVYADKWEYEKFFEVLDKQKPRLLIIDSLYQPFFAKIENTRTRAVEIKKFLTRLRPYLSENNIGCVITTPAGRIVDPESGKEMIAPLGGQGVKLLSDVRVIIEFVKDQNSDTETTDKRLFIVDRQGRSAFKIEYGGHLSFIK